MKLSVAIIAFNEEANLARTLESVKGADEIVVVDSGSTDRTVEIAQAYGAKVFVEAWKGFAAQKNSALAKCSSEWVLSLDADEEVTPELAEEIARELHSKPDEDGYVIPRRNMFLGRWIRRGGFYPDAKLRLFKRSEGSFAERAVHETARIHVPPGRLKHDLIHHSYPTLETYLEHMNRYSTLGAQVAAQKGKTGRRLPAFLWNVVLNPLATFLYNYVLRLGFLDGREGLLLHLYHSGYVSWKYAKAWGAAVNPTHRDEAAMNGAPGV